MLTRSRNRMKTASLKIPGAPLSVIIPVILFKGQYNLESNVIDSLKLL